MVEYGVRIVLMYSLDIFLNHFLSLPMSLTIFPFTVWETGTSWDMDRIRGMGRCSASVRVIGRVGSGVRIIFMYSLDIFFKGFILSLYFHLWLGKRVR